MSNTVFDLNGPTLTVKPIGELDSMSAPIFEEEFSRHLSDGTDIIVDFKEVSYISSAGIRALLATENALEKRGAKMKLIHVNEHIIEIFELVGFMDVITVE